MRPVEFDPDDLLDVSCRPGRALRPRHGHFGAFRLRARRKSPASAGLPRAGAHRPGGPGQRAQAQFGQQRARRLGVAGRLLEARYRRRWWRLRILGPVHARRAGRAEQGPMVIKERVRAIGGQLRIESVRRAAARASKCSVPQETVHVSDTTDTPVTRILIADDHPIFRDGLRQLLESEAPASRSSAKRHDGAEAVKLATAAQARHAAARSGDAAVTGLEALRELAAAPSPLRDHPADGGHRAFARSPKRSSWALGAWCSRNRRRSCCFKSIRCVMAGEYWVGRERRVRPRRDAARADARGGRRPAQEDLRPDQAASWRSSATIVAGYANKDIAQKFSISEETVKHHLTNIFDKTGVSNASSSHSSQWTTRSSSGSDVGRGFRRANW